MKRKISLVIRATVSIALMAVLIYMVRDSIPKMLTALKGVPVSIILFAYALFVISTITASVRLKILLSTKKISMTLFDIVKLTFVGYFFSSFLPTAVGGDVAKAFYISKASGRAINSYTTVFMDRFLGMCSLFLLAIGAFFCLKEIPKSGLHLLLPLLLLAGLLISVFLFNKRFAGSVGRAFTSFIPKKIKEKARDIYEAIHSFKNFKLKLLECLFISAVGQSTAFVSVYILAIGLKSPLPLMAVLLVMPISAIVSMVPSIYGTGPREMSIVILLSPFIGKDGALAIAFLWLGLLLTTALIGGIIHLVMGRYKAISAEIPQ
ncbi:MAG: flippase-like domain-containing protein [Candidatus Omnitrophica bacterium]|nr:flippase-like domain-containing protein [Candidatus Omnitrophota bacterium]